MQSTLRTLRFTPSRPAISTPRCVNPVPSRARKAVLPFAKRAGGNEGGSFEKRPFIEKEDDSFRVSIGTSQILVPEQTLLLSGLALLGLGAVIGPIVLGLTVAAITIGVSVSVGAFAISTMFLPLAFFMFFFLLTFGGFFGSFALLGVGVFFPKLLSLIITGAGLAIGWTAVRMFLPKSPKLPEVQQRSKEPKVPKEPVPTISPEEEEAKRISAELRDFDAMLADREHQKRVDRFKGR